MENFNEWFCLNNRLNFTIDAQINPTDAQYYFGRDDTKTRLEKQIRRSFIDPGVPKMMVFGPYGSGKTQTLFYLRHYLEDQIKTVNNARPRTIYVPVEMQEKSKAANLHKQLMQALGKDTVSGWVRKLFDQSPNLEMALSELTPDTNVIVALRELRAPGEASFAAWRWLTCQGLGAKDLSALQLTIDLAASGSKNMAEALVTIGNMAKKVGEYLIFLVDEMESLQYVRSGDTTESIHLYIRNLAEKKNSFVGFLISFKADVLDEAPESLRRNDVMSRVGNQNYMDIPPLPAIADVKAFMRDLLLNLTLPNKVEGLIAKKGLDTKPGVFPFAPTAFELLADYTTQDITRALPRNIINAINECAIQAWDEEKALVDESIVNAVAPYVFQ
jgi:hypothetical protein